MNPFSIIGRALARMRARYDQACDRMEAKADAAEAETRTLRVSVLEAEIQRLKERRSQDGSDLIAIDRQIQEKRDAVEVERARAAQAKLRARLGRAADITARRIAEGDALKADIARLETSLSRKRQPDDRQAGN